MGKEILFFLLSSASTLYSFLSIVFHCDLLVFLGVPLNSETKLWHGFFNLLSPPIGTIHKLALAKDHSSLNAV